MIVNNIKTRRLVAHLGMHNDAILRIEIDGIRAVADNIDKFTRVQIVKTIAEKYATNVSPAMRDDLAAIVKIEVEGIRIEADRETIVDRAMSQRIVTSIARTEEIVSEEHSERTTFTVVVFLHSDT